MTTPGARTTPVRSRWSDSTLSTPTPTSPPTDTSLRGDNSMLHSGRRAPSPIPEDEASVQDSPQHAGPRPGPALRKSTTSSSQRSGEITIMFDPVVSALPIAPRPKSTSNLPSPPPWIARPPVIRLPSGHESDGSRLSAIEESSSRPGRVIAPPPSIFAPPLPPLPPLPSANPLQAKHVRSMPDFGVSLSRESLAKLAPVTSLTPLQDSFANQDLKLRPVSSANDSLGLPSTSPIPKATFRARALSNLLSPSRLGLRQEASDSASSIAGKERSRSQSTSNMPDVSRTSMFSGTEAIPQDRETLKLAAKRAQSPAVSAQSVFIGHSRNPSTVSAISKPSDVYTSSERPPPIRHSVGDAENYNHHQRRLTRSRLESPLPPPPPSPPLEEAHQSRPSTTNATAASLLSRIGTISRLGKVDPTKYQRLDDDAVEDDIPMEEMRATLFPRRNSDIPPGVDLSFFAGPQTPSLAIDAEDDTEARTSLRPDESRHRRTSTDDMLEAKGHLTGGLGIGMASVVTKNLHIPDAVVEPELKSPTRMPWKRDRNSINNQTELGQRTAQFEGAVIAVDEQPSVDLSNVAGGIDAATPRTEFDLFADSADKQSYYFPPDPQMPNWKPFTMQPWYIGLLILLAVIFFVVIEVLCQLSIRRAKFNPPASLLTFTNPANVSDGDWFVWKYLPEALFVTYGVLFQATDFQVRRLEPYYQMSRPTGAKADESLNLDYLTFWSYLIPFKAWRHGQWAVVLSSVATILSSALIPILFSASLYMYPQRSERTEDSIKYVRMDPVWSRLTEAALVIVVIASLLLLLQLRRKSGLVSSPKGIAGIAAMATKSHILNDFRGLDMASHRTIHKHLAHRRYILHKSSLWQGEYISQTSTESAAAEAAVTAAQHRRKPENPHPLALHLQYGLGVIGFCVFFVIFVPVVEFVSAANVLTDRAPWFLTLLATVIKVAWSNVETAVRVTEPFYVLSRRHAPPRALLLDYTGSVPCWMPLEAARNGHALLAAVGVGSILCEVLTVVVSSFNIDGRLAIAGKSGGTETRGSYVASFALAQAIPVLLAVVLGCVLLRRRHAFLPRLPSTIASVLAFLAQSRMLYDFVAQHEPDAYKPVLATGGAASRHVDVAQQTVRLLEARGKRYGLGWYRGRDGTDHLGVDEEELLADYRHGVDWSKGRMGGAHDIGRWEAL